MFKKIASWFKRGEAKKSASGVGGIFGDTTPEALCGIEPETMDKDDIKVQLAMLYKRHNHAAGSLNQELRDEASLMLDAIVHCRQKYVDISDDSEGE